MKTVFIVTNLLRMILNQKFIHLSSISKICRSFLVPFNPFHYNCNYKLLNGKFEKSPVCFYKYSLLLINTVNIYKYTTIEGNGNTIVIPTTSKSFRLYGEFLQPLWVIYQKIVIYLQRLKEFPIQVERFASSWNYIGISISLYSFVPIDVYSVMQQDFIRRTLVAANTST